MIRKADFWSGVAWLLAGLFVVWQGHVLGLGRVNDPGSGFAVFWIGILLSLFSLSVIVSSARGEGARLSQLWAGARWPRVLAVVVLLIAYGATFESLGFLISTTLLLLVLMLAVDRVAVPLAVAIAVGAPAGIWFVMTKWLKIQLPAGLLASWLG